MSIELTITVSIPDEIDLEHFAKSTEDACDICDRVTMHEYWFQKQIAKKLIEEFDKEHGLDVQPKVNQ